MMTITSEMLSKKLEAALQTTLVTVLDTSGGCGASFEVAVVSDMFQGKTILSRHRMVHEALKEEMPHIHALSIKCCWTSEQQAANQGTN